MPKDTRVDDYRYDEHSRKHIPEAGPDGSPHRIKDGRAKHRYAYDPHLPPVLRFDGTGRADQLCAELDALLQKATEAPLTEEEAALLADALCQRQPWLEWATKREAPWFEVEPVALHIHERLSAQAIIKVAQRQPLQRSLFADPELEYREAVRYYQHDVDWSNRLILGDSAQAMASLVHREGLAGNVQMIYVDPPYGIGYRSNFQPRTDQRSVGDRDEDLTRDPEQIRAYRDTWTLGIHSYLAYLRDRLTLARELLADTGSIFVQIGDENVHRVAALMDEVFGSTNFMSLISFRTKIPLNAAHLPNISDYLVWYAKDKGQVKFSRLFVPRESGAGTSFSSSHLSSGESVRASEVGPRRSRDGRPFSLIDLMASGYTESCHFEFCLDGRPAFPNATTSWKTTPEGIKRLIAAKRIRWQRTVPRYVFYADDYPVMQITNQWSDTQGATGKLFAVQTANKVIERCMLMTTAPGDLVLDPTCGSGTTAYVAEQWGRRWITMDTSRVAVALARQRLLTAKYDYYRLADPERGMKGNFVYEEVPHITLGAIAQNQALDPIFAHWEPILADKLAALNAALEGVDPALRTGLLVKLAQKEQAYGKRSITEADRRRWMLPKEPWQEWQVPYDTDEDWPAALQTALRAYREAWRAKMDQVNATIAASAPTETLYDRPQVESGVLRVSGPFTVEAVRPAEPVLGDIEVPIGGEPEALETFDNGADARNADAFIEEMVRLLKQDGVRFPGNRVQPFERLELVRGRQTLHAEGEWVVGEKTRRVGVSVGPEVGPVTVAQVARAIREAYLHGYEALVFAGMSFDAEAQAAIEDPLSPEVQCHLAHIRPDVVMGDLLKETVSSQLFTVFGQPRVALHQEANGEVSVEMQGVDIYDPLTNSLQATGAGRVAAWFVDHDYNGRTFCVSQAFFPDRSAWDALKRGLRSEVAPERFEAFSGTRSLPFRPGERIAVKVIDPRGNEVMKVLHLGQMRYAPASEAHHG